MKTIQYIILAAIITISLSCSLNPKVKLIVTNQSPSLIDSVTFNINGYKCVINNVGGKSDKDMEIEQSLIPSNKHDIMAFVAVYIKDKKISANFYNDLTGSPGKSITAVLNENMDLVLKPEW